MRQVTLVALYGEKAPGLSHWLEECQTQVRGLLRSLGTTFEPYDLRQLHATLVGPLLFASRRQGGLDGLAVAWSPAESCSAEIDYE